MAFIKKKILLKIFEKVEKTGIISTKFSFRCTPSVILGVNTIKCKIFGVVSQNYILISNIFPIYLPRF